MDPVTEAAKTLAQIEQRFQSWKHRRFRSGVTGDITYSGFSIGYSSQVFLLIRRSSPSTTVMRQPYSMATTAGEALTVLFPTLSIVTSFRLEGVWRGERGESDGGRRIWASAVVLQ